ncbi:DUF1992 domain-containing protein [Planctomycetales bacterium ZRK34]|nr:DUF1992 domain-containing protein [Planctomycetales bacterium ZRK34]
MSRHRDIMAGAWRLADNRIREAMGRGEFDDLPGAGSATSYGIEDEPQLWPTPAFSIR